LWIDWLRPALHLKQRAGLFQHSLLPPANLGGVNAILLGSPVHRFVWPFTAANATLAFWVPVRTLRFFSLISVYLFRADILLTRWLDFGDHYILQAKSNRKILYFSPTARLMLVDPALKLDIYFN
jgi:hypothetical protein